MSSFNTPKDIGEKQTDIPFTPELGIVYRQILNWAFHQYSQSNRHCRDKDTSDQRSRPAAVATEDGSRSAAGPRQRPELVQPAAGQALIPHTIP